jgi:uncharacterized protein (DUF1919 family)
LLQRDNARGLLLSFAPVKSHIRRVTMLPSLSQIEAAVQTRSARLGRSLRRPVFQTDDFAIISNNCRGAHIYRYAGLRYNTPFVNLFILPDCYLTLLGNLDRYLKSELRFAARSKYSSINAQRERKAFPIGVLAGEIEIQFVHYTSTDEAQTKWKRRVERFYAKPFRKFVKFCDRDGCEDRHIDAFDRLPYENKVFFSSRPVPHKCAVYVPSNGSVPDGQRLSEISAGYFDAELWVAGQDGTPRWWRVLRPV